MKQVQVSLTDDLNDFVETSVASGQYASGNEVLTEGLRLLVSKQSDEAKLKWLREAVRIGLESGDAGEVDIEDIIAEANARRAAAVK